MKSIKQEKLEFIGRNKEMVVVTITTPSTYQPNVYRWDFKEYQVKSTDYSVKFTVRPTDIHGEPVLHQWRATLMEKLHAKDADKALKAYSR